MDDITTLNTNYWQHASGTYGGVVCDLEDVWQCYETIMGLDKGDVPYQPNLGANLIKAADEPLFEAEKRVRALLLTELPKQEPRGKVKNISTEYDDDGKLTVTVTFCLKSDETQTAQKTVTIG